MTESQPRREILKKLVYVTPVVLTFAVAPSFASRGSGERSRRSREKKEKK